MLFTDFDVTLGASGSSLISSFMPLVSMALLITSLNASQLFAFEAGLVLVCSITLSALFALFVKSLLGVEEDDGLLELFAALSVDGLSQKMLLMFFEDTLLLVVALVEDFVLPSELLFDSLSSTENEKTLASNFLFC